MRRRTRLKSAVFMPIPLIILEGKNDVVYYTAITLANLKVLEGKKTQIVEGVFMTV